MSLKQFSFRFSINIRTAAELQTDHMFHQLLQTVISAILSTWLKLAYSLYTLYFHSNFC